MHDRHRQEREQREREAWRLRLLGWTQRQIADELGVTQQGVALILRRIETRLAKEFAAEAFEIKARQTAQLEQVYRRALEEWERSCEDAERVTVVSGRVKATEAGAVLPLPDLETTVREGQTGNPALLAQAMKALADIRAIWGLEAPARQEISAPGAGPVRITEVVVHLQGDQAELAEANPQEPA